MTVQSHAITPPSRVYASGIDDVPTSRSLAARAFLGDLVSPHGGAALQIADRVSNDLGEPSPYQVTVADQSEILATALRGAARSAIDSDGHLRDSSLAILVPALTAIVDGLTNPVTSRDATPTPETQQAVLRLRESLMWLQAK